MIWEVRAIDLFLAQCTAIQQYLQQPNSNCLRLTLGRGTCPPEGPIPHLINHAGLVIFAGLAACDRKGGEARVEQRKELRDKQIQLGDREVFVNEQVSTTWDR